jgi:hypothetical protein
LRQGFFPGRLSLLFLIIILIVEFFGFRRGDSWPSYACGSGWIARGETILHCLVMLILALVHFTLLFATPKRVRLFAGCKDQLRPCPTMLTIAAPICCGLPLMAGYDTWKTRDPRSSRKSTGAWLQPLGGVTPPLAISASGATSQKIPGEIAQKSWPEDEAWTRRRPARLKGSENAQADSRYPLRLEWRAEAVLPLG